MSAVASDDFSLQPLQSVTGMCVLPVKSLDNMQEGEAIPHCDLPKFLATVHVSIIKCLQLFATEKILPKHIKGTRFGVSLLSEIVYYIKTERSLWSSRSNLEFYRWDQERRVEPHAL